MGQIIVQPIPNPDPGPNESATAIIPFEDDEDAEEQEVVLTKSDIPDIEEQLKERFAAAISPVDVDVSQLKGGATVVSPLLQESDLAMLAQARVQMSGR